MAFLSIVIPTRNRPEHLQTAIASVLDQQVDDLEVIISDNSDEEIARKNRSTVEALSSDKEVNYLRPPELLSMVDHWNWAVQNASGNYVTILTDRMVFKKNGCVSLCEVLQAYNPTLIAYPRDLLRGDKPPYRYTQLPYTGKLFDVSAQKIIALCRDSLVHKLQQQLLPLFLNSAVSREALAEINTEYGNIFSGIAPDYSFCFKALDCLGDYKLLDKPILISGGDGVSNGKKFFQKDGQVRDDFISLNNNSISEQTNEIFTNALIPWVEPVPLNIQMLEYVCAQANQRSGLFYDVNCENFYHEAYLKLNNSKSDSWNLERGFEALDDFRRKHNIKKITLDNKNMKMRKLIRKAKKILRKKNNIGINPKRIQREFGSIEEARKFEIDNPRSPLPSFRVNHLRIGKKAIIK